ncbi:MAG TPA: antibiotic biosynthesis monooxygenase [Actinomycetes bacterium]|nr:antibiotic biosynthesis monooxygenase [Actinomycetes bacterium]
MQHLDDLLAPHGNLLDPEHHYDAPDDRPGAGRGGTMIARIWKGAVRQQDGDAYARYMQETGVAGYAESPGNRGVWMLRRDVDGRTEFVMFTLWDSLEAVRAFAGDDYEAAVFYPEDERFLVERDLTTTHYQVDTHVGPDMA